MAIAFDAVGAGGSGTGGTLTETHVLGSSATAILVFALQNTFTNAVGTCLIGSTTVPSLGTFLWRSDSQIQIFGLIGPPTGSQTITLHPSTASGTPSSVFNSVSYTNVASFGTFAHTTAGSGTSVSETVTTDSTSGDLLAQAFAMVSSGAVSFGSYNQTSRYNSGSATNSLVIGDAAAGSSVSFTATASASPSLGWAGASVPLVAVGGSQTLSPTTATAAITGGTPKVVVGGTVQFDAGATGYALATSGSTGTTATWSHPLGTFASGLIVAVTGDFTQPGAPSQTSYTRSLTMNGTAMTLLGITDFNPAGTGGYDGWTELWGIYGTPVTSAAGTSATLVLNEFTTGAPSTKYPELSAWSGSYSGVVGLGTAQVTNGNNAAPTVPTITSNASHMVVGAMGSNVFSGGSSGATVRYNVQADGYGNWAMLVEDAPGSGSGVSLSGVSGFGYWSAVGVDLIAGTVVSPTTATVDIAGGTPTITTGSGNVTDSPATATVAITGGTPTVTATANVSTSPTTATVDVTGGTPAVVATGNVTVAPTTATVVITGGTPSVSVSSANAISPTTATVHVTGGTPAVTETTNVTDAPASATVHVSGGTPTVTNSGTPVVPVVTPPRRIALVPANDRVVQVIPNGRVTKVPRNA